MTAVKFIGGVAPWRRCAKRPHGGPGGTAPGSSRGRGGYEV